MHTLRPDSDPYSLGVIVLSLVLRLELTWIISNVLSLCSCKLALPIGIRCVRCSFDEYPVFKELLRCLFYKCISLEVWAFAK